MADIRLVGVTKRFGALEVIPHLSLDVASGEFVVFLGPSGCGKSTLLRMIAGLEQITSGEIRIADDRVDRLPPGARGVAMVFQHYALYPHMTVRENMAFGLRNVGAAPEAIEGKVREAAEMLEIGHLLERKPGHLSGGQRQRVAIGRAIVKEPRAFLFDEPLSNLDAALRARTRVELARLHRRVGTTMIFVTHDQVEAMTMADRIVVLNNGRVEQEGTPLEIYRRPATRFVAGFIGSPAMNFLPATAVAADGDGGTRVRLPDGAEVATAVPAAGANGEVTFGIRAEGVRLREGGATRGRVEVVERLGDRTHVHVLLGDGSILVAEEPGDSDVTPGGVVPLAFDRGAAHLFDAAGRSLAA